MAAVHLYSHFFESYGKEGNTKYKVDSASDCPMLAGQGFLKLPAKAKDELLSQNPSRHAPILCRVGCMGKVSTWCFLTTRLKYYGFNTCTIPDIGNLKLLQSCSQTPLRSALRMCTSSRSMGQILLPQGQGRFSGSHTQRWSKAAAVTLRRCSPHPPRHQCILPVG